MQTTIDTLQKGQKAVILSFDDAIIPLKLIEMGCMEGNFVEVIQIAPLGDPIFLSVNDTNLAIRKEMASRIFVEIQK
ncbi:FeoA family protein [Flavobacterium solisilvae]|uniref:Ferrous iron transport protein A n=1 Tax=Flavobacterium solisilvae TaxID=1852019 RepID=A0ABX1QXP5_9FLAO|nr:FeoA family protein [Flavobacterium solisilvae]NMH25707.1 ferrous iron transport protein A [Flavobacterium solisilvae]